MKYITTPLYYVNDKPHLGHSYTSIACDTLVRFAKLNGEQTYFLTGTDEHGQKVAQAAASNGQEPQDFVDKMQQAFRDLIPLLQINNDDFIRTTEKRHKDGAIALWHAIEDYIYLDVYKGWYAIRDEAFYQESELVNGKAPTGADVVWSEEESYFFKLSAFSEPLLEFYQANPDFIYPKSRYNEVVSFVKSGLKDLSVSRTNFSWGIPIPNNSKHVMYVWLDALSNYITALDYPNNFQNQIWDGAIHVVGKDILRFHAVYWPAFLMAAKLPLPKQIIAHGWWTIEGEKMSKSLGNVISPIDLVSEFSLDTIRYHVLREIPFGQDGDFSKQALINRHNADLSNTYGNLVQRVLGFIYRFANDLPKSSVSHPLLELVPNALPKIKSLMDGYQINRALEMIWEILFEGNKYIDTSKPWDLKDKPEELSKVLNVAVKFIYQIAVLNQAFLPVASAKILQFFGIDQPVPLAQINDDISLQALKEMPTPLFARCK